MSKKAKKEPLSHRVWRLAQDMRGIAADVRRLERLECAAEHADELAALAKTVDRWAKTLVAEEREGRP